MPQQGRPATRREQGIGSARQESGIRLRLLSHVGFGAARSAAWSLLDCRSRTDEAQGHKVNFRAFKNLRLLKSFNYSRVVWFISLCCLCVLWVSMVNLTHAALTTEIQRTQSLHREFSLLAGAPQGPQLDYSNFKHTSQRHTSLACTACHQRNDNSATPRFPGHKACTGCHLAQFVTPDVPTCAICHTDVNSSNPPLRSFPAK